MVNINKRFSPIELGINRTSLLRKFRLTLLRNMSLFTCPNKVKWLLVKVEHLHLQSQILRNNYIIFLNEYIHWTDVLVEVVDLAYYVIMFLFAYPNKVSFLSVKLWNLDVKTKIKAILVNSEPRSRNGSRIMSNDYQGDKKIRI